MNRKAEHAIQHLPARNIASTLLNYSWRVAVFAMTVGGMVKYIFGRNGANQIDAKGEIMSASHNGDSNGNDKRSTLLKTILTPKEAVETKTDDFLEKARALNSEDYSKAFDEKVGGHSGFSASLRRSSRENDKR